MAMLLAWGGGSRGAAEGASVTYASTGSSFGSLTLDRPNTSPPDSARAVQVVRSQPNVIVDYAEVKTMDREAQRQLLEAVMETADQDNFRLMQKVADRLER